MPSLFIVRERDRRGDALAATLAISMALIAVDAVVDVVANTLMLRIGLAPAVAARASKYGVVG